MTIKNLDPVRLRELIEGKELPDPDEIDELARELRTDPDVLREAAVMDELAIVMTDWSLTPARLVQLSLRTAAAVGNVQ